MTRVIVRKRHEYRKNDRQDGKCKKKNDWEEEKGNMESFIQEALDFLCKAVRLFAGSDRLLSSISALCVCNINSKECNSNDNRQNEEQKHLIGIIIGIGVCKHGFNVCFLENSRLLTDSTCTEGIEQLQLFRIVSHNALSSVGCKDNRIRSNALIESFIHRRAAAVNS